MISLSDLKNKTAAVVGIGISNRPLIDFLLKHEMKVVARDLKSRDKLEPFASEIESKGVTLVCGENYLDDLSGEIIFKTPGLRFDHPSLLLAKEKGGSADDSVEIWSLSLAKEAAMIAKMRSAYIEKLARSVSDVFSDMTSGKEKTEIIYRSPVEEEQFVKMFTSSLEREIRFGTTLFGPHKDDFEIFLNSHEAKNFASQGQQRSVALA